MTADRTALREAFARQMERTGWSDFARDRTLADFDAALAATPEPPTGPTADVLRRDARRQIESLCRSYVSSVPVDLIRAALAAQPKENDRG